jgi:hypothetical protein
MPGLVKQSASILASLAFVTLAAGYGGGGSGTRGGMTYNTVPSGTSNLFTFVLDDGRHAIMDALAR